MRIHHGNQIIISRQKTTSGYKKRYVSTATADADIQPLGKDRTNLDVGLFGSSYVAYVDEDSDIQVDDRVVDNKDNVYTVTDVVLRDYGAFPYKEVILKKS
jgi:hypothetical protein